MDRTGTSSYNGQLFKLQCSENTKYLDLGACEVDSYLGCKTICVSDAQGIYIKCELGNKRLAFNSLSSQQKRQVHSKGKQERPER